MGEFAKALENLPRFSQRRHPRRINRHFDDRDALFTEAFKALESRTAADYPNFSSAPATLMAPSIGAGAATGLVLVGTNLLGDAVKASASSTLSTGVLDLEAVLPGEQTITVTYTDTGAALAVSAADAAAGTIALVTGDGGGAGTAGVYTVAEVLAVINAHAEAKYMVEASSGTAGDLEADETITLSGGEGDLLTLDVGGFPMDGTAPGNGITAMDDTSLTIDIDPSDIDGAATALVAGSVYALDLRVDGVKVETPFIIPVA